MTDSVEFYAPTVDEAVEKAALEMDLSSAEVSYSVLDEGNSGFLGIGARDARILVEVPALHASDDEDDPPETTAVER
ncbi:MAG TPA: Jag N-terminal domain-containing protein, partial [Rubrobacter sp.]|nr:Jag N-terminal domain-containing protein [Rubrobacter sp.]